MKWLGTNDSDVLDLIEGSRTTAVNVRCPGRAHAAHSELEPCLICDAETDGTVEVLLTHVERDALACVERGRPFDRWLAPRLVKIGLLERRNGKLVLTEAGRVLVSDQCAEAS
jgi:hypothetical protein